MRWLLFVSLLFVADIANAADYAVVVSQKTNISKLDSLRLKEIFLKKRSFDDSVRVIPVNLLGDEPARREFEDKILMMERDELKRYWVSNHFQGVAPPTTQASLQSVKRFVESVSGAIGYIPISMVDSSVKVVYEF